MYSLSPYLFISLIAISTLFWGLGINGDELWNYNFMKIKVMDYFRIDTLIGK